MRPTKKQPAAPVPQAPLRGVAASAKASSVAVTAAAARHGDFDPADRIDPPSAEGHLTIWVLLWALLGWLVLGFIWWRGILDDTDVILFGGLIWAGCVLFWTLLVAAGVTRDKALARRHEEEYGGRKHVTHARLVQEQDALGRALVVPDTVLKSRVVTVDVEGERKFFREGSR
jgi:hypothetical protein